MTAYPMVGLVLLVDALAVYRLTRLLTADAITFPVRRWAYRRAWHPRTVAAIEGDMDEWADAELADVADCPRLPYLVRCRWCASVWIAAGVVLARCWQPDLWAPVAVLLALATVGTLLAQAEG